MTVNPLANLSGQPLVILITVASSCGFLLFGYDNGVFSGILVLPWFLKTFHNPKPSLLGTISATYNLGGFLGSMLAFFCGNYLGRRRTILSGICITAIGAIVQCVATHLRELVPGRILTGFGVGAMTSTIGLWQAETVPARSRGKYLCVQLLAGAAGGLFLAQWINYGFHASKTRAAFTFPLAFQFVFLVVSGALVLMLPESPRWLVKHGRTQEARAILARLPPNDDVDERLARIVEADELEKSIKGNSYAVLFSRGPTQNLQRLSLCVATMVFHQLVGINSVTYYMPTLLTTFAKVNHDTSLWVAGLLSVTSMISALVPVLTIDRIGRRPFLYIGALWQTVAFAVIAALVAQAQTSGAKAHSFGIGAIVMVFLFYAGNAASWLPVSWCYPAEILPSQIREKGLALGNVFYWLFQFMIVEITPIALRNIKYKFYVILAIFNFFIAVAVYMLFPETKQLSLEQIDLYFADRYSDATKDKMELEPTSVEEGPKSSSTGNDKTQSDPEHIEKAQ